MVTLTVADKDNERIAKPSRGTTRPVVLVDDHVAAERRRMMYERIAHGNAMVEAEEKAKVGWAHRLRKRRFPF